MADAYDALSEEQLDAGSTSFIRCAQCHELYQPAQGISLTTGKTSMYWTKPKARRTTSCTHESAERWDGAAWQPCPIRS